MSCIDLEASHMIMLLSLLVIALMAFYISLSMSMILRDFGSIFQAVGVAEESNGESATRLVFFVK
ncbi:hypothetical protein Pint_13834 [Pistacia integerrima]|uniref:Uncharacterized protein n=1 Tax=Pistacia integerrima TaxID=434235 RepID=A0ACC0Y7R4_9ROSI|nr:hypothetical protein Pint_13834 [Pistacia integerrima]